MPVNFIVAYDYLNPIMGMSELHHHGFYQCKDQFKKVYCILHYAVFSKTPPLLVGKYAFELEIVC